MLPMGGHQLIPGHKHFTCREPITPTIKRMKRHRGIKRHVPPKSKTRTERCQFKKGYCIVISSLGMHEVGVQDPVANTKPNTN